MLLSAINFDTQTLIGLAIDAVLVLILIVFLLVGIKKGLIKMCCGLISSILVIVVAVMAAAPVATVIIDNTNWDNKLTTTIATPLSPKLTNAYAVVYYSDTDDDETTPEVLVYETEEGVFAYDDIFKGDKILGTIQLQKIVRPMVEKSIAGSESSKVMFVDAVSGGIVYYIFVVAAFIAVAIVAKILLSIIFYFLRKLVCNLYIIHFVDKLVGAVLGLTLAVVIGLCLITVLQLMQNLSFMEPVNNAISHSYITKFITEHNFLYDFVIKNVSINSLLGK